MAIAGRVAIVPKGDWSADATYKRLDAVTYNNTLYFAKKDVPAGTATSNTEYWSKSIVGGVSAIATKKEAGIVKPADGLTVAEDGTLKVNIDGTTLTMDQVNNVIKLADTLKEKINGAFPAANVVNNQITTETGYALDARQANPNIDGTLAKQVSDLNGSLYGVTSNIFSVVTSDSIEFQYAIETKIGNLIFLNCSFHVKQNIASWNNLLMLQYSNENIIILGGMFQSQNTHKAYVVVYDPEKYVAIRTDSSGINNDDWLRGVAIACITSTK